MSHSRSHLLTSAFLSRGLRGDAAALGMLATRLRPVLEGLARHLLPPVLRPSCEVEDLIQEVWVIVLQRLGRIEPRGDRRTPVLVRYLRSTMTLHVRTLLRRELPRIHRRERAGSLTEIGPRSDRAAISAMHVREAAASILDVIDGLPEPKREIVFLRAVEQRPNHEVARHLGIHPDTVSKIYRRTLAELRSRWPDSVLAEL